MINTKNKFEIDKMRKTSRLAAETLKMIEDYVKVGITTNELNNICHDFIIKNNAIPSPLNYHGYPKSICTSVNHQVCHGIPGDRVLREGDIINVDITTNLDGFHGDTSKTFGIGRLGFKAKELMKVTKTCLDLGIKEVKPGAFIGDIGAVIQDFAKKNKCSVVREYCGHGIGRNFHEDPAVPHYGKRGDGPVLKPGMIFTIEPMINFGRAAIRHKNNKWTAVTKDRSLSAQYEHTILVTETGFEVLTDIINEY